MDHTLYLICWSHPLLLMHPCTMGQIHPKNPKLYKCIKWILKPKSTYIQVSTSFIEFQRVSMGFKKTELNFTISTQCPMVNMLSVANFLFVILIKRHLWNIRRPPKWDRLSIASGTKSFLKTLREGWYNAL